MKLICWWLGTDALTLRVNPPSSSRLWYLKLFLYRIKWKLIHRFFEHWSVHKNLVKFLNGFGIKDVKINIDPPKYITRDQIPHDTFNVLYYRPNPVNLGGQDYIDWYYGYEIFKQVKKNLPFINFIEVDGTQDLKDIYPYIDCYIRPNYFDGMPRMVLEAELLNIPYIWISETDNNGILKPSVEKTIKFIEDEYHAWVLQH